MTNRTVVKLAVGLLVVTVGTWLAAYFYYSANPDKLRSEQPLNDIFLGLAGAKLEPAVDEWVREACASGDYTTSWAVELDEALSEGNRRLVIGCEAPLRLQESQGQGITSTPNEAPTALPNFDDALLIVRKIGLRASITYRMVGSDGVMPDPEGPDDVAYYDFAAWPGKGGVPGMDGNAVFAGHVDSNTACDNGSVPPPCRAVFWDLDQLEEGDEIEIRLGGSVLTYGVTNTEIVNAETAPWDRIVSSSPFESVTLITVGGNFNPGTEEYSDRLIVTAVRR